MDNIIKQSDKSNWQSSNIGIVIMAIIFLMPFGLILLAMLTFGKNINLANMFKDFWHRIRHGANFDQPNLWGNGRTKYNHPNSAFNAYRRDEDAKFNARQAEKRAALIRQEQAFYMHKKYRQMAEDKAHFEAFKSFMNKSHKGV